MQKKHQKTTCLCIAEHMRRLKRQDMENNVLEQLDQNKIASNLSDVKHLIKHKDEHNTNWDEKRPAVSGEGFLARHVTFENTAGANKHQAVALRINADLAAVYRCAINGKFDISETIDCIFGNAAVVFQACNIMSRMPMAGQFTVITAQSRDTPDEDTGISMQNCSILATDDLYSNSSSVKNYLGRPWRVYSRVVCLESYIDDFIDPKGWTEWVGFVFLYLPSALARTQGRENSALTR
ncbi:hypothetical protein RJ640_009187 [Escallonia rubra]|uniref:Pectinesterase catalytic domain-containing protein n=1 Tax=Escallonia rubra TaxID=112253 RepID=A0AA88RW90_9ASTE|nr:hypothetical protein RJ640_009187 [Escallonia rubra]